MKLLNETMQAYDESVIILTWSFNTDLESCY